jgi:hypothetical protein
MQDSALMLLNRGSAGQFEKLTRERDQIEKSVDEDRLENFFKTAWHLIEIVEKDPATTQTQKDKGKSLRKTPLMTICCEIANSQKHFRLDPKRYPRPTVQDSTVAQGFGRGRFGKGAFGKGEQSVRIDFSDGTSADALALVRDIFQCLSSFQ